MHKPIIIFSLGQAVQKVRKKLFSEDDCLSVPLRHSKLLVSSKPIVQVTKFFNLNYLTNIPTFAPSMEPEDQDIFLERCMEIMREEGTSTG